MVRLSSQVVTRLPASSLPTNKKAAWVVALAIFLPLLAFGSCMTRGSDYGPMHTDYLIQVGLSIVITLLGAWLARPSIVAVILFILYGSILTVAPERYWQPKDQAFAEKVRAIEKLGESANGLMEDRPWPCSGYHIHYDDGEFWTED